METISEFLARTAKERQQRDAAAAGIVISTTDKNPDQFAGDMSLAQDWAKETGKPMPPMPLVEEYRPVFQQQIEAKRNSTVLSSSPKLAEWLQNPQNAALAKDDVTGLSYWERVSSSFKMGDAKAITQGQEFARDMSAALERGPLGRGLDALGETLDSALLTGGDGSPNLLGRLANFARERGVAADGVPRQMVGGPDVSPDQRADAMLDSGLSPIYDGAAAILSEMEKQNFAPMSYKDVRGLGSGLQFISENFAMSLPQMAATMTTGAFSPLLQVISLGGEANAELKERTDLTNEQRVAVATGAGVVMAGLDYFGLSRIFGGIPAGQMVGEAIDGTLVERLVQNGVSEAVGRTLQAALAEGTTEALQEAIVVGVTSLSGGEYTREEVVDRFLQAFTAGGGAGAAMRGGVEVVAGGNAAARRLTDGDQRAVAAADTQAKIAEIAQQSMQSKLRARMPDVFRAWVEKATENGPAENLYVPADKFTEYFQGAGLDPFALADELDGVTRSDLETALSTGGDLRIPTATYAAKLAGSDADQFFMENMRFDPDEFTSAEARAFEDTKAELMAEAQMEAERVFAEQQELRTFEEQIYDSMVERLRTAGRATDVATNEASLYPAFYKTWAQKTGIPLDEFIRRYPLPQVRGDIPQGMQPRNVDELTRTLATARAQRQAGVDQPNTPLLEFISNYGGISDMGGELAARDAAVIRRGRGRKNLRLQRDAALPSRDAALRGYGPDDVAMAAIEAGFMADNPVVQEYKAAMERGDQVPDVSLALWEEIDKELGGQASMTDDDMNAGQSWDDTIAELDRYLGEIGMSLDDSDADIRAAIERDQAERGRMYGQFAGPQSETADIHALANAKDMIARGMDAEAVRRETGWFRGPDMKWRYEITDEDARFVVDNGGVVTPEQVAAEIGDQITVEPDKRNPELFVARWGQGTDYTGAFGRTEEDARTNLLRAIAKKRTTRNPDAFDVNNIKSGSEFSLGEILDHDRLFAAYPDLRMIPVAFDTSISALGQVNGYGTEMTLNPDRFDTPDDMLSTLLHEVQHLIQRREGFARGGNTEISGQVRNALQKLVQSKQGEVSRFENENRLLFTEADEARRMVGYANIYQDFDRLIGYSKMDAPSGVFRHIRNATGWFYTPLIQENTDLRARANELQRSLYTIPRRGAKRNAFLRQFSFDLAQFLREAVPPARWEMLTNDKRKTASMLKALEREASKASAKLKPHYDLQKDARIAKSQFEANQYRSPFEVYQLLAGEVEARNTQNRAAMTEAERRDTPPEATMTRDVNGDRQRVSTEDVIVVLQSGEIDTPFIANMDEPDAGRTYGQGAVNGGGDLLRRLLAEAGERIDRRNAMADQIAEAGRPVTMQNDSGLRVLVGPNTIAGEKPFRVTYIGADGKPNGHVEAETLRDAAIRAMEDGFAPAGAEYGQAALQTVEVDGIELPVNFDGTVTLYHGTTAEAADAIMRAGVLRSAAEPSVYVTSAMTGDTGYGDGTVVAVDVMPSMLRLDDEFHDGRADFAIDQSVVRVVRARIVSGGLGKTYAQPAYHGSPHLFEKFSLSAIGTGEGAQAFGWGLYFAGRKAVAEWYRKKLSGGRAIQLNGESGSRDWVANEVGQQVRQSVPVEQTDFASGEETYAYYMRVLQSDAADAMLRVEQERDGGKSIQELFDQNVEDRFRVDPPYDDEAPSVRRMAEAMRNGLGSVSVADRGRLFEVDIPDDAELLDWDAPLKDQPAAVLEKLKPLLDRFTPEDDALLAELGVEVTGGATGQNPVLEMTGAQFYEDLANRMGALDWEVGANADQRRATVANAHRRASEALRDAGIPGHRFLDGGSRADGDGSRNYVIYDDSRIQVTRFEQEQRGSVAFPSAGVGNGETVISLFRKADLSTFLHESGHYFLTVMQDLAAKGEASAVAEFDAVKAEWRKNADAVAKDAMRVMPDVQITVADVIQALDNGTTGDVLKDAAIDVGMQEQFARGFEAYLLEGKAPSVELRGAFEKFRAWLLSVYKSLRGLNVDISPEMRGVFDRMLATDDEIAQARQTSGDAGPMFKDAPAGMSAEDFERYRQIGQQAQDEAAARLLAETMAPIKREAEAAYRAEKAAVRAEVEPVINARKEYRAFEWMANRRMLGGDQPTGLSDMRMSRQVLVERYGEGVLKTLPRGRFTVYANEGGVDPDVAAGMFGFSSGDELIRALEQAPKRTDAIDAEVEKVMFERHGDPLRDGTVEAKALEAVHGDKRARVLALELDILRASPGGTKSAVSVFREMARGTLANMRVRDAMAANRYLAAERKAGEASYRAFSNGDLAGAAEAKRRQLLNHMLYSEATKIEAEVLSAEKLAARLQKKSTRDKLAGDYLEAIDEILNRYDFRKISAKAEDRRGALLAFVERMKNEGRENELAIPERVLQDAVRTPYKRLTVEHLRGVVDSLKNIEHTARLKQKLIDAQSQRDLDAVVDDILGSFDKNVKQRPPERVGTAGEKTRAGLRGFLDLILNAGTLLREIDGFKDFGPAFSNIKAPIDAAMNRLQGRREKAANDLDALYDVYTKKERRAMAVRQFVPEINASLSKWERIAVALNMGNEGNYQRLTDTKVRGGFTEAQVKAIVATLDARDAAFVQSVWDYLDSFRGDIEAREKRVTGVAPKWVEARPVQIAGVDLKGGYYPLKYDPRLSSMARDDAAQDIAKSLQAGRFGKAQTRNGHLKERATSSGRAVELDIAVLHRHVQQVVYDLELSEPVANSWRIMQDGRIRDAFTNTGKQADFDALEIWLKDVAEGELRAGDVAGQMARRFKSNFTAAKLAFNLSTVAVQITGVAQSMVVVGKVDFLKGAQMALRPGVREEVHAKSQFMRDRSATFNKDIFDLYNDPRLGPVASRWTEIRNDWIAPAGFWLMTKVQSYLVDVPTWLAGYQQGLRKFGNDEAKAIAYADDIVKRSQASGIFSDRSAVERGSATMRARQNEFLRLFTTLGSYMFAKFNVAYERTGRAQQVIEREGLSLRSAQEALSWTVDVAFLFTLEAVLYAAIKGRLPDEEDDEEGDGMSDEWAAYLAKETALSFMSTIPFVRDVSSVLTGFGGGGAYGAITEELAKPLIQAGQGEVDAALVKSVISATGLFTGLPAGQINRAVDAGWRQAEGEDVSPAEYLLGRMGK